MHPFFSLTYSLVLFFTHNALYSCQYSSSFFTSFFSFFPLLFFVSFLWSFVNIHTFSFNSTAQMGFFFLIPYNSPPFFFKLHLFLSSSSSFIFCKFVLKPILISFIPNFLAFLFHCILLVHSCRTFPPFSASIYTKAAQPLFHSHLRTHSRTKQKKTP